MAEYLTQLMGHVARYGIRAEDASITLIEKTVEEFSLLVCQKTGMSFNFLTQMKARVLKRVQESTFTQPRVCQGRNQNGLPCKRKTLIGYCADHVAQEKLVHEKKRRLSLMPSKKVPSTTIRPLKFLFP